MKTHIVHFSILALILVVGSLTFLSLAGNPQLQAVTGITMAVAYVAWGIVHHSLRKDLHVRIVIEYILVGGIALVFLFALLA
jgi:hypothetical protein